MSQEPITLVDIKAPHGSARYTVDPQIPMSAMMTTMLTSVKKGGAIGLFGNSRDSVLCHRSLATSDLFSERLDFGQIMIGSYRSICVQLLFMLSEALELPAMLEVLSPDEQAIILSTMCDMPAENLPGLIDAMNDWKINGITPEALSQVAYDNANLIKLANLVATYEQEMKEADLLDYPGAAMMLVDRLIKRRELVRDITKRYPTIFVDLNGIADAYGVVLLKELVRAGIDMILFCPAGDKMRAEMAQDILPVAKDFSVRSAA